MKFFSWYLLFLLIQKIYISTIKSMDYFRQNTYVYYGTNIKSGRNFLIWAYLGMKFFFLSTFFTDSENIYIDYKFNGPFSIEHPDLSVNRPVKAIFF